MTDWMETNRAVVFPRNCDHLSHLNVRWHGHFIDDAGFICGRRLGYGTRRMSVVGYSRPIDLSQISSALPLRANLPAATPTFLALRSGLPPTADTAGELRQDCFVESPGGISPPGAPRTVREPLDSYGS